MTISQSEYARKKRIKTAAFIASMIAILGIFLFLSSLERPPEMPKDKDHRLEDKNDVCMNKNCHPPEKLPETHPLDHEKFACIRCHDLAKFAKPKDGGPSSQPSSQASSQASSQPSSQASSQGANQKQELDNWAQSIKTAARLCHRVNEIVEKQGPSEPRDPGEQTRLALQVLIAGLGLMRGESLARVKELYSVSESSDDKFRDELFGTFLGRKAELGERLFTMRCAGGLVPHDFFFGVDTSDKVVIVFADD